MKKLLVLLTVIVLGGCAQTRLSTTSPSNVVSIKTPSYVLNMDASISEHRREVIKKAVSSSVPANLDVINIEQLDIKYDTAGIRGNYSEVTMMIPRNDVHVSDAVLAFMVGHELAHREPDIDKLGGHEEELVCDAWGMMAIIDMGYNPQEIIDWIAKDNAPSSSTHPSDKLRAEKLREVVRQYKGL